MTKLKSITVFCGGSSGNSPVFEQVAYKFGQILALNDITLVYGAGGTGVMRALADGCLAKNGKVVGVTIHSLYEIERPDLVEKNIQKFEIWRKMSDRKVSMTKQSEAICVLPGGIGTLDELFEILALRQLHIIDSPLIVVNVNGYFNTLKNMLREMVDYQFVKPHQLDLITFVNDIEEVLPTLEKQLKDIQ